jgi:putative restriction endonuclease
MSHDTQLDHRIRSAVFRWLDEQAALHDDVLPWQLLSHGFRYQDERVPLIGPQGIFKPKVLPRVPISITTSPNSPYDDSHGDDFLLYRYRGEDPNHPDNAALRLAQRERIPLVYFFGLAKGRYLAVWPVFVVHADDAALTFTIAVDDKRYALLDPLERAGALVGEDRDNPRRAYITASARQRLHQRGFRERVLTAYRGQCALCRLRHRELLDAAHIVPDSEPGGEPVVRNGLSLCKLHHAAFDRMFLGISPDYRVEIRGDILLETDGPMLRHGLQGLHGGRLVLPRRSELRPDPDLLAWRFERFREAG